MLMEQRVRRAASAIMIAMFADPSLVASQKSSGDQAPPHEESQIESYTGEALQRKLEEWRAQAPDYLIIGGTHLTPEERKALALEIPVAEISSYGGATEQQLAQNAAAGDYTAMYLLTLRRAGVGDMAAAEQVALDAAVRFETPALVALIAHYHWRYRNASDSVRWIELASKLDMPWSSFKDQATRAVGPEQLNAAKSWANSKYEELREQRMKQVGRDFDRVK